MCFWQVGPPTKKAKPNTSSSNADEEPSWLLDRNRFVKVHEFKGKVYVDIREFYESDGELKPSRKGGCTKNLGCYVHLRVYVHRFCQVNLPHLFFHA
jgi:hypothetical protein